MRYQKELEVAIPPEFQYKQNLNFLRLFPQDCLYKVEGDTVFRAIRMSNGPVLVAVSGRSDRLVIAIHSNASITDAVVLGTLRYVEEWFDLKNDIRPFYALARQDTVLQDIVEKYHGLYLVGIPDFFEALSWAIMGQQINTTFAHTLKRRFIQLAGENLVYKGTEYWLFPLPEKVARLAVSDLLPLQFSERKAEYLLGIAKAIAEKQITKELLCDFSFADSKQVLMRYKGIGEWTADYVLLKCFRQPDALPVGDAGLQNAVKNQLALVHKPTAAELTQIASGWQDWKAYATFYLWRTLFPDA